MAGAINITKTMDKIVELVGAVGGLTGRVYAGKKRYTDAQNVENDTKALTAESQGYFWVRIGKRTSPKQTAVGNVVIIGVLYIPLPKDTTTDTNTLLELAESVLRAVQQESQYRSIGVKPGQCSYEPIGDIDEPEDGICEFVYEMEFDVGMVGGSL